MARPMVLTALVIALVGCSSDPRQQPVRNPVVQTPCVVAAIDARCGSLTVPENRDAPGGRTIALNIVVLPAGRQPPAEPVFYLAGGPGQGATTLAGTGLVDRSLREHRDLVFVDQRGTGRSNPLDCELPGSPEDPQGYLDEVFQPRVFEKCREALAARADVRHYTTAAAADDLDDVRAALGYSRIILSGGSYGTRAALTYMRRHPAHVRAAVLNGVAPPSLLNPLFHARNSQSAIDIVFDECAADRACRAAFPNVREEFQAVLARLDREPAPVPILAQPRAGAAAGRLNRYAFADAIRMMMYRVEGTRRVPLAVHRAYGHDYSIVVRSAVEQRRSNARLAHGMLLSTTCQEDIARIRDGDISQASERTFLGPARVRQQQLVCGIWPTGPAPAEDGAAVASDAPVLLLSGTLDPVTPPRWADEALQSLPNGKHLVVPGAHGVGGPCIEQIVRDFVRTGSAQALDTACTSGIKLPPFVIR